jgi:hypothetical protein
MVPIARRPDVQSGLNRAGIATQAMYGEWMNDIFKSVLRGLCILALSQAPVSAHHSAAMFEQSKTPTLTGTVRELQWTNPHCWLQIVVLNDNQPEEWSLEMGAPVDLLRGGWTRNALHPGDKVTVTMHPSRDGSHGGLLVSAAFADGRPISKGHH